MRIHTWFCTCMFLCLLSSTQAKEWVVGPGKAHTKPSQVSNLVGNGDTITIIAGEYVGDVAFWKADGLLLRGKDGLAHLNADGKAAGQKAIWVIQGDDITVEQIEFSNCTVADKNGAGIRQEGTNLTVRKCWFHDNENGILAGNDANSTILVEYSEFGFNGFGDGFSHNIYVNHVARFIFRYNYSHNSKIGHLVKSRAHENHILYNRLDSQQGSGVSYEIDLPNGGLSFIIGNQIFQPVDGQNSGMVSYGQEGLSNPGPQECYVINNTLINAKTVGRFFNLNASTALFKGWNNLLAGGGDFSNGPVTVMDTIQNLRFQNPDNCGFVDFDNLDLHLMASSPAIDKGLDPEYAGMMNLWPTLEYVHVANFTDRAQHGLLDVGAYEGPLINAVVNPDNKTIHCWKAGNVMTFQGLEADDQVAVWDLQGRLIGQGVGQNILVPDQPFVVIVTRRNQIVFRQVMP